MLLPHEYIHPSDDGANGGHTIWHLKSLTVGDIYAIDGVLEDTPNSWGKRNFLMLQRGIVYFENFVEFETERDLISREDYVSRKCIEAIPENIIEDIINEIKVISYLKTELEEALRNIIRTQHLKSKAKENETWDCEECQKRNGLQDMRKCPLTGKEYSDKPYNEIDEKYMSPVDKKKLAQGKIPKWLTLGGHKFKYCPAAIGEPKVRNKAVAMYNLVMSFGEGGSTPQEVLSLPFIIWQARNVIYDERALIEKMEKKGVETEPTKTTPIEGDDDSEQVSNPMLERARQRIRRGRKPVGA